jgi:hypothetical protein
MSGRISQLEETNKKKSEKSDNVLDGQEDSPTIELDIDISDINKALKMFLREMSRAHHSIGTAYNDLARELNKI